jgi:hypothetical protein
MAGGKALAGMTIRQYEVYNPGPAALPPVELSLVVPNKYLGPEREPEGLHVERVGSVRVGYQPENRGLWTSCTVTPWHADKPDSIDVGKSFGIRFVAGSEGWQPEMARVDLGKQRSISAEQDIVLPRKEQFGIHRWILAGISLLLLVVLLLFYFLGMKWRLTKLARDAASEAEAEIRSRAFEEVARGGADLGSIVDKARDPAAFLREVDSLVRQREGRGGAGPT